MPPEDKPPMPPLPKTTVQIEVPPDWAIDLSKKVADGFSDVNRRLVNIESNQDLLTENYKDLTKRTTALGDRMDRLEERQENNSIRVQSGSEVDAKHDAAIGLLSTKVDAVDAKVDTLAASHDAGIAKLAALMDKPLVRKVGAAAAALAIAALTAATSYLAGHQQQPAPPAIVIAPAPTATEIHK